MREQEKACVLSGTILLASVLSYIGAVAGVGWLAGPTLVLAFVLIVVGTHG